MFALTRHVRLLLLQGLDDVSERGQREVDGLRLLQPLARGVGSSDALGSGQINNSGAAFRAAALP